MAIYDDVDGDDVKLPVITDRTGKYLLNIEKIADGKSRKDGKGYFKAEVQILESAGEEAFPPNTRAVVLITEDKWGYYKKDIARFVAAVLNEPVGNVKGPMVAELVSKDQPGKNFRIHAEVAETDHVIKSGNNAGKCFVGATFSPAAQVPAPA